jgi:hypothetical protein
VSLHITSRIVVPLTYLIDPSTKQDSRKTNVLSNSSQGSSPPPSYSSAAEISTSGLTIPNGSRGLIKAGWYVITHAKLYSLLTAVVITISALGTRQIWGFTITSPTNLATRDVTTSLGPDIDATQPIWSKVLGKDSLDSQQVFMLLNLWTATSILLSLLCLSATIAKAYSTGKTTSKFGLKVSCGWIKSPRTIYRVVKRFITVVLGTIFMSPEFSWRRSSWKYTIGRILLFTGLLATCALLLRQALSLAYMMSNNTSTSFSTLPDVAKSQKSLSNLHIAQNTSFLVLNAIIMFTILILLIGWYALVHARSPSTNTSNKWWKSLIRLSILKYIGALTIIISFSLALFFFTEIVAYNNTILSKVTSFPSFAALNLLLGSYALPLIWAGFELWDLVAGIWGNFGWFGLKTRKETLETDETRGRATEAGDIGGGARRGPPR